MSSDNNVVTKMPSPESTLPNGMVDTEKDPIAREFYGGVVQQHLVKKVSKKQARARRYGEFKYIDVDENGNEFEETIQIQSITKSERDKIYKEHDSITAFMQPLGSDDLDEVMEAYGNHGIAKLVSDWNTSRNRIKTRKILYGCLVDWCDDDGNVVWSVDPTGPRHEEQAVLIIESWDNELIDALVEKIDSLGGKLREAQNADLQGK